MADLEISVGIDARQTKTGGAEAKREIKQVGDEVEKTGRKAKSAADRDFKELEKSMRSASIQGNVLGEVIGRAFDVAIRLGVQVVQMAYNLAKGFAAAGAEIYKAQQITKLSAESLSALFMQARRTGTSVDELGESFKEYTRLIGEAATGSKEAEAKMKRLGIDPVKAANDLDAAYRQVLARIVSIKNPVQQANAAMDAFGETGYKLLPFIKSFNGDIDALIVKATELGVVMTEKDVKAAKELDDMLKILSEMTRGLALIVGKELGPVLQEVASYTTAWLQANRGEIRTWGEYTADTLRGVANSWREAKSAAEEYMAWANEAMRYATGSNSDIFTGGNLLSMNPLGNVFRQLNKFGRETRPLAPLGSSWVLPDDYADWKAGKLPLNPPTTNYFGGGSSSTKKGGSGGSAAKKNPLPEFGSMRDLVVSTGNSAWDSYFVTFGNKFGVDPNVLVLQAIQESGLNPRARSPKGAAGISQFMPDTAKRFGVNVNNVYSSIGGQAKYMSFLLSMFGGDYSKALAGYNAGEGNVQKYGGIPPFKETRGYVAAIKSAYGRRVRKGASYGTYDYEGDDGTIQNVPSELFDTLDLSSREKAIELGKQEIQIYQQLADSLWNLKERTHLENAERDISLGLYDELDPKIKDAIRNWARLTDEENARKTALSGYNDMLQDLDGVIQQYNVQLGLSAELTRADAAAKFLASDAAKALTDAERQNLKEKAAHADQLRAVTKAQEEANRQYEQFRDTILDGLDAMQDGAGSFFSWMYDRFKNFLKQMVAEWLASKFFNMFFGGGNQQAAQANGGGGGMLGGIFQSIFGGGGASGQGPGGTPMFNGNATQIWGGPNQLVANPTPQLMNTLNLRGGGTYTAPAAGGGGWRSIFQPSTNPFTGKMNGKAAGVMGGIGAIASVVGGMIPGKWGNVVSMAGTGMSIGAMFGPWGAAIGAGVGALIGLFTGNKAEKRDKKEKWPQFQQGFTDAMKQLRDLINDVRTLRIDPDSAISQATEIRQQMAAGFGVQFESKKYKKQAQQMIASRLLEADSLIEELRRVAEISRAASERDRRLLPEFAGGIYMSPSFRAFRRMNGMLGGAWTGRDTIPAMLAAGEMILNPMQQQRVRANAGGDPFRGAGIPGYADGGVVPSTTIGGLNVYISQDAAGIWTGMAESERGQKVIARIIETKYTNGDIKLQKRTG